MQPTPPADLDRAIERLGNHKEGWVHLPVSGRIALARSCVEGMSAVAEAMVLAGCQAKGVDPGSPAASEEWFGGPVAILRNLRLLIDTLVSIDRFGRPRLPAGAVRPVSADQLAVRVFPGGRYDRMMFPGTSLDVWMQPGITESGLGDTMGVAYQRQDSGKTALVLGAGNVASIGPMDLLYKLFVENQVVVLKLHPVNEYLGPLIERAFDPLVKGGYLSVVYGDAAEGQYLVHHPGVDEIHMTGSAAVHDRIVWGDSPEEQSRRRAQHDPKVRKRVTSELGCVTPVLVLPGDWTAREMTFQAEHVATMVAHNASCNCNAAKLLVTWSGWRQREAFLDAVSGVLSRLPRRKGFYPGAAQRYAKFTAHPRASRVVPETGMLPYATIYGVDPAAADDIVFREEAWCPIIAETALDANDESAFAAAAAEFCNERVAGTLSAVILVDPRTRKRLGREVDRLVSAMKYGTVGVNEWAAASYVLSVSPWGAYPGHTLEDVGSGIGFVHNTFMFDRPQKTVLWAPFTTVPKPPWFSTHRRGHVAGRRMAAFEAAPSLPQFASLAVAAMRAN